MFSALSSTDRAIRNPPGFPADLPMALMERALSAGPFLHRAADVDDIVEDFSRSYAAARTITR
jgi:hypothetical protein